MRDPSTAPRFTRKDKLLIFNAAVFLLLCSLLHAQEPGAEAEPVVASKEYFVQQQAGEAIVIRVGAFEAEFTSRLSTEEGEILAQSGLPDARMLPLYQFVTETDAQRQIDIDIAATQVTNRTEFELELTRLNVRDERSARLAAAYRLLSVGLESLSGSNVVNWTVKVQTLMQAGSLFREIGMEEMALWCRTYAAHLVLHRMRDHQTALDWAEELLGAPRIERYPEVVFAAGKVRSTAMIEGNLASAGGGDPAESALQTALAETVRSARAMDYRYEEARALQAAGVDLKRHGAHGPALQRLNQALEIAEEIGAADLAAGIREHMVEIHEEFGDVEASGEVLQDIESHLLETGVEAELAANLLRQGRLYMESHRYLDAIEVLSRVTELEQSILTKIEAELALGTALYEAGRGEEGLAHLYRAAVNPQTREFRQPSGVLDLDSALGGIAAIHRGQGDFARMAEIRSVQREYLQGTGQRSRWAYQRAIDALIEHGVTSQRTLDRFKDAFRQARTSGEQAWAELSRLRLCALPAMMNAGDPTCEAVALRTAFESLRTTGTAPQAAEASMVYAGLLGRRGQAGRALGVADAQIEELLTWGREVLGAWYWQWREPLFENYLGLTILNEGGDATRSLLALARARAVERGTTGLPPLHSETSLRTFLDSLPRGASVLGYYLGEQSAHAWLADHQGTRRFDIDGSDEIRAQCADFRHVIQSGAWNEFEESSRELGAALLQPVAELLPESVYIVSQGALLGIPVDALMLDGRPFAERHRVVHLDVFPAAPGVEERLDMPPPAAVFLAGDPRDWSGDYPTRLNSGAEIRAVTERFVGPGLHSVQGVALLTDEFADGRYAQAELAHLSIPGVVDLSPARASTLFLSEPARGEGRQRLTAEALRSMPLGAGLVFFSRTEFSGVGSALENRIGVVSATLEAGAKAVIASLWPVEEESRTRFTAGFYDHLEMGKNTATALALAKRDSLKDRLGHDWASFQLFLR